MKNINNTNNRKYDPERKSRIDRELERLQSTIAYQERIIRDLRDQTNVLRHFALEQIWFDKDLVERLGKPYLPSPPCLPQKEEADEQQ